MDIIVCLIPMSEVQGWNNAHMEGKMEFQKNDLVTVRIEDMSHDGEGIGKVDGYTLFIKDAVLDDVVQAKIMKCKKNYGYARLEKVLTPSSFRVEPKCRFARQCGGCQIQSLSYEKQLEFKQNKVKNNLIRLGGFSEEMVEQIMEPIVGMEEPYHYRNKAQYPIGQDKEGNPVTGFYAGRTHTIIPNTKCFLGNEVNEKILEMVLTHMSEKKISPYNEETHEGLIRHILIRNGFHTNQIMVCIVVNAKPQSFKKLEYCDFPKLVEKLKTIEGMTSISLNFNYDKTNVILGKEYITIWGEEKITDYIYIRQIPSFLPTEKRIAFQISPLSFYQVNPQQTEKLYSLALEYAQLTGKETVWDLYCGIGTISLFLAQKAKQVYGVEIIPQAIEDAKENVRRNDIQNAQFFVGKAEEILPKKYEEEHIYADVIVVDPPRKGCDLECLNTILKMQPERVVYVSCDSATLARDLKILCEGGYELRKVRAVDQFGHTVHVETVCLLSRKAPV